MRFEAIRRILEKLRSGGDRSLEADADSYTDSELAFGKLVLPILEDVEVLKKQLDVVSRRAKVAQVVLDGLPVAALVLDDEGHLLTMNKAAQQLFGGPAITARVLETARKAVQKGAEEETLEMPTGGVSGGTLRFVAVEMGQADDLAPRPPEGPSVVFLVRADRPPEVDLGPLMSRFSLSRTEANVVSQVAKGATNKEVADQMGVSIETIRTHLANSFRKTGARNRAALVGLAFGARFGHGPLSGTADGEEEP